MDLEMQDIIERKYRNIDIEIFYIDIKKYGIKIGIEYKGTIFESLIEYNYDAHLTIYANCDKIKKIIDNIILSFYKRGV